MAKVKVIARYRRRGNPNPFEGFGLFHPTSTVRIRGEADENMPQEELEKYAIANTPRGYEFIEVIRNA